MKRHLRLYHWKDEHWFEQQSIQQLLHPVGSIQIQQYAKRLWILKKVSSSLSNSHNLCHQRQAGK
jgi:hypothetical protein